MISNNWINGDTHLMSEKFIDISREAMGKAMFVVFATLLSLAIIGSAQGKTAPESFADLAEKLLPSVVNISTTQTIKGRDRPAMPKLPPGSPFEDFFKEFFDKNGPQQRSRRATSLGSGFVISKDGYVVTNNHVIADADEITVILHDDTRLPAKLIGRDPRTDIAVLKIKQDEDLPAVGFGNSDTARVGDWVVAIGNPFGLGGTVTAGIISARGRDINSGPYDDFIQTDASINRGNSGGPMFNLQGKVIGINTAIFSPTGGSVGIGFAIPATTAKPVIDQLIKSGAVKRGWLGVHIQTVTDEIAETLGLDKTGGALVASVIENSPADKSRIKPGDVILTFDGKTVDGMRSLPRIVAETEVGKDTQVSVWRNGEVKRLSVAVGELEDGAEVASRNTEKESEDAEIKAIGLTLSTITSKMRSRFKLAKDTKGLVVTKVAQQGPAVEKNISEGDVIVEVSQQEVASTKDVVDKIDEARRNGRQTILLLVQGQGGMRFVVLRLDKD